MQPSTTIWSIEGDLLQATMAADKLGKKESLSEEEKEKLADLEKRKDVLARRLREARMKGY